MIEVEDQLLFLVGGVGIFVDAGPLGRCQLDFDPVVGQEYFVIAWTGYFRVMAETGTIAAIRVVGCARI